MGEETEILDFPFDEDRDSEQFLRAANVYVGPRPTTWFATGVPHDGYLSDFLMRNKGFARTAIT